MKQLILALTLTAAVGQSALADTVLSYQGSLTSSGQPANGLFDFVFALHTTDTGGTPTGSVTNAAVGVTNGLFATLMDFGAVFADQPYWLAVSVRTNGAASFTALGARQRLTATPRAIHAVKADTAQLALGAQSSTITSAAIQDGVIANADISASAAIADTKLATITSAGKVANSATTATSSNVPNTIVARNANGDFGAAQVSAEQLDVTGFIRSGVETGTPGNINLPGLIYRRMESTNAALGTVVARTDNCRLIRDGTTAGLRVSYDASSDNITVNAIGLSFHGTNVNVRMAFTASSSGFVQLFSNAQRVVHARISFGSVYDLQNVTHVVFDRFDSGAESDYYMVGTITSTYNQ